MLFPSSPPVNVLKKCSDPFKSGLGHSTFAIRRLQAGQLSLILFSFFQIRIEFPWKNCLEQDSFQTPGRCSVEGVLWTARLDVTPGIDTALVIHTETGQSGDHVSLLQILQANRALPSISPQTVNVVGQSCFFS